MLFKLVHWLVLLCYVNILAYEAGTGTTTHVHSPILNGESILEFVLDDVLEIPIDKNSTDVHILYDEYRVISTNLHLIPLFILLTGFVFSVWFLCEQLRHPTYDGTKLHITLGYYKYLHLFHLY
ncbi:MAG: hypothetical protein ACTJHT_01560 [Sphingobacterium sp.]|uniref:hypothetical protein n=1 Tax=Sphingobacterium sp. JB170 TaxID=1434842 RepID=UPI000B3575A3|nr:hypothetical protein [Sphingobacterium sp. JB170]